MTLMDSFSTVDFIISDINMNKAFSTTSTFSVNDIYAAHRMNDHLISVDGRVWRERWRRVHAM